MKSMTGFGTGEFINDEMHINVEIKTINHRYRDFNIRMPRKFSIFEDRIRKIISEEISRGRIDVSIKLETVNGKNADLFYDKELAKKYYEVLNEIKTDFPDAENDIRVSSIARFSDVITEQEEEKDMEEVFGFLNDALIISLKMLSISREEEGETLKKDFIKRLDIIEKTVSEIKEISNEIPVKYNEQLLSNLEKFDLGKIDQDRIATEIAIYAERVNITEELVRLKSHITSFKKVMENKDAVGRKLDFTLQEMNREANTIASKSNSFEISSLVIEIKSELEKIREQIQNIE